MKIKKQSDGNFHFDLNLIDLEIWNKVSKMMAPHCNVYQFLNGFMKTIYADGFTGVPSNKIMIPVGLHEGYNIPEFYILYLMAYRTGDKKSQKYFNDLFSKYRAEHLKLLINLKFIK
ncbi:hypothetical protein ACQW5G_03485 [Fructilactobacillus sp. Tb1]|uniref:hypothetical protein n=1 Tax=Fructilactobacillus sp. Tb1 TaxID=3422304 RepID=UPI003D2BE160